MERSIQLLGDGKIYEMVDGGAISVVDIEGSTDKLIEALQAMQGDHPPENIWRDVKRCWIWQAPPAVRFRPAISAWKC